MKFLVFAVAFLAVGASAMRGPSWTYDPNAEAPAGEKDMGGWTAAMYTEEQQQRLGVDEMGHPVKATTIPDATLPEQPPTSCQKFVDDVFAACVAENNDDDVDGVALDGDQDEMKAWLGAHFDHHHHHHHDDDDDDDDDHHHHHHDGGFHRHRMRRMTGFVVRKLHDLASPPTNVADCRTAWDAAVQGTDQCQDATVNVIATDTDDVATMNYDDALEVLDGLRHHCPFRRFRRVFMALAAFASVFVYGTLFRYYLVRRRLANNETRCGHKLCAAVCLLPATGLLMSVVSFLAPVIFFGGMMMVPIFFFLAFVGGTKHVLRIAYCPKQQCHHRRRRCGQPTEVAMVPKQEPVVVGTIIV